MGGRGATGTAQPVRDAKQHPRSFWWRKAGEALRRIKQHLKNKVQRVADTIPFSYPSAKRYIQIAKHWEEIEPKKSRLIFDDEERPGPSLSAASRYTSTPLASHHWQSLERGCGAADVPGHL
jgi:hypothetical protein